MQDWSGFVTASSLPAEITERIRIGAELVRYSARTPQPSVTESFASRHSGIPALVESLPGGAVQVAVGTFSRFQPGPRAYPAVDPWDVNQAVRGRFMEFAGQYLSGRVPVREGPNPSGVSGVGIPKWSGQWPHLDSDSPHGAVLARRRRSREEARLHDGDCSSVHPYQTHRDWAQSEEEEERALSRENRFHEARMIEIQEKRRALSRSGVGESRPGWTWCSKHQRWTRAS